MTETTTTNNEIGTCVGCRLPCWKENACGCCRKTAALVIAGESGVEITEILVPAKEKEKEHTTGKPDVIIGVRV